jgi:hypothetical protein
VERRVETGCASQLRHAMNIGAREADVREQAIVELVEFVDGLASLTRQLDPATDPRNEIPQAASSL